MESGQLDAMMETLGREALGQIQLRKFQMMLDQVLVSNAFYKKKLGAAGITKSAPAPHHRRLPQASLHDQEGALGGPGQPSSGRNQPHLSPRAVCAHASDLRNHG